MKKKDYSFIWFRDRTLPGGRFPLWRKAEQMKITAEKNELMRAITTVMKAVPSKTTMSILYCILIDATVDTIRFTGNDTELGIETAVDGVIEERGLVCLEAKLFSEIIRKLPNEEVTIASLRRFHPWTGKIRSS